MAQKKKPSRLREESPEYRGGEAPLVRTQVYFSVEHRRFLAGEAKRRGISMAELLREWIEEKMKPNEESWADNPLLEPTPEDPTFAGRADGSEEADRYIYGSVEE